MYSMFTTVKVEITCIIPVLQAFLSSFQHVLHIGVGRSQIEWKLKAKIGKNDHSNPYNYRKCYHTF